MIQFGFSLFCFSLFVFVNLVFFSIHFWEIPLFFQICSYHIINAYYVFYFNLIVYFRSIQLSASNPPTYIQYHHGSMALCRPVESHWGRIISSDRLVFVSTVYWSWTMRCASLCAFVIHWIVTLTFLFLIQPSVFLFGSI